MERVIELDASWDLLEEPPQRSRAAWVQHRRLVALAVVVLLSLATLGAARPAPAPVFTFLGFVPSTARGPSEIFLVDGAVVTQAEGQTIAYEPTGQVRWKRPGAPDEGALSGFSMWRGHLLEQRTIFPFDEVVGTPHMPHLTTTALDPATGEQLWQVNGYVRPAGEFIVTGDGNGPRQIYKSIPDGPLWTVPPARASAVDAQASALFTVTIDGVLTEYDLATGKVRRTATVEVPRAAPANISPPADMLTIEFMPSRIILRAQYFADRGAQTQALTYDRATLRSVTSSADNLEGIWDCGPVLCGAAGESISILDRETRTQLWQAPHSNYPYWTGSAMLVGGGPDETKVALVDPFTGATLVNLDGWSIADPGPPAVLVTKFVSSERTFVGMVRPSGLQVLGVLPFQIAHCQTESDLMACTITDGRTAVWRLNR